MNNFEKIKQMDIDEMAEFVRLLRSCDDVICDNCFLNKSSFNKICANNIANYREWLQEESE